MKKSDIKPMPEYFDRYINLIDEVELQQAFVQGSRQLENLDKSLLTALTGRRYAPGKWTVNEIFQHLIDWERILCSRALLFARIENSAAQGVDENLLAANMNAEGRTTADLVDEMKIVRASTKAMFESFDDAMLRSTGTNWKSEMSVLAIGFTVIGHQIHHLKTIEEEYYPLLETNQLSNG